MDRRQLVRSIAASSFVLSFDGKRCWGEAASNRAIAPPNDAFIATLPRLMELAQLPGVGIGVVGDGRLVWEHYAGVANAQTKEPINAQSLFPGASMGKQVFAYAVLRLVDEDRLDLDRPLKEYLKDDTLKGDLAERITARHVLSHSSGLPNWRDRDEPLIPSFEPGTRFRYSGEGFYLLQRCVEKITGVGFEEWIQEQMMMPLRMTSSTYLWREDAGRRLVAGHRGTDPFYNRDFATQLFASIKESSKPLGDWNHDAIVREMAEKMTPPHTPIPNETVPNVAFSLLTTVADYASFVGRVVAPRGDAFDLKPRTRTEMMKPYTQISSALKWGLGWGIEEDAGRRYLWQWGDNGGWKNFVLAHPESHTAVVVFTNGNNGMRVVERIVRAASRREQPVFLWV